LSARRARDPGADLEAVLLGVEGQGRVLIGDREHHDADVRQGGGRLREIVHALKTTPAGRNHRPRIENFLQAAHGNGGPGRLRA
jgi:hypothetical protein